MTDSDCPSHRSLTQSLRLGPQSSLTLSCPILHYVPSSTWTSEGLNRGLAHHGNISRACRTEPGPPGPHWGLLALPCIGSHKYSESCLGDSDLTQWGSCCQPKPKMIMCPSHTGIGTVKSGAPGLLALAHPVSEVSEPPWPYTAAQSTPLGR